MLPFKIEDLEKMIEQKYVSRQWHESGELQILNYTHNAQFDNVWDDVTLNCRGLILNKDYSIHSRCMKKFFNYEEYLEKPELKGQIPTDEVPHMLLKYDGSMGILYWIDNIPYIATRGSFVSDQAIRGTKILHEKYKNNFDILRTVMFSNVPKPHNQLEKIEPNFSIENPLNTVIFEIIYPENRICVDYNGREDLIQLALIDNKTGGTLSNVDLGFPRAEEFRNVKLLSLEEIKELDLQNQEGFVCYYNRADFRMKIKFKNYLRLHKIMTNVSSISIWEYLKENKNINEIINNVPDEFMQYVKKIIDELRFKYNSLEQSAKIEFVRIRNYVNLNSNFTNKIGRKKDFALEVQKLSNKKLYSILFAMYDSKDYSQIIWKMLRPEYEQPFKTKIEDNEH